MTSRRAQARGPSEILIARAAQGGILAAAVSVFARLGFAKARVEDILFAAGIARRTFYKYFTGKEDVLAQVYEVATAELLRAIQPPAGSTDPLAAIRRGVDVYLDYHVENAALVRVLVEQAIRLDSPLSPARRRFRAALVKLIDDAVRSRGGEGYDTMTYIALISALEGLSLELLADDVTRESVARAKRSMHTLLTRLLEHDEAPARRKAAVGA